FENLKQNLEYKVQQRTKELNEANREMITNQLNKDKLYNELQIKTNELVENNKRLQELDKMKSEFVHMVNHELRSPMVTIKGYTELLLNNKNGELPDQAVQKLAVMQRSINRLNNIIENIRALTIIDSDRKKIRISKINAIKVINDVYNDMLILTGKRRQNLKLDIQNQYPSILYNEEQLYQCLANLITNSIRYSPDGSDIIIGALCNENEKEIIFYVKDTGMGIEEKEFKNIFLPFYEIKNIKEHHSGTIEFNSAGTGLGLTIVKKIVESYNGRVWVESPGLWKGSTFYFTVPFDKLEKGY
ncbi:HAMP domain-containing histidine kinase, partial [Candidatus Desantisbacteria bacterium]|nr:HAMP domain-containing histidine kinase [Candidatus Desantisbacteria bacterium]